MTLTPTPANEERIQYLMGSGLYATVDEVLTAALDRLLADQVIQDIGLAEFQKKIDEGWEEAERGNTISSEELEAEMDRWRARVNASLS